MANRHPLPAAMGNTFAAKDRMWRRAIVQALERRGAHAKHEALAELAEVLLTACANGESWAFTELGNRLDGKPAQSVTITGDEDGGPMRAVFMWAGAQEVIEAQPIVPALPKLETECLPREPS